MARANQLRRVDPAGRFPEEAGLLEEATTIFASPEEWMRDRHPMLGGRSPQECIDAGDEQMVWDLLRNIKYVGQT
jgi:uncharacterized protein (DUF2384 family)